MGGVTICHNPRCSKSRSALALMQAAGITPQIRLYLQDAPSLAEITAMAARIPGGLPAMLRPKEAIAKDLGLTTHSPQGDILSALAAHPVLIERPIVQMGDQAIIARPPELVDQLIKANI